MERVITYVGDVDEHAQAIQLGNNSAAESAQAAMVRGKRHVDSGRVGEGIVDAVRQGEVDSALGAELAEYVERLLDEVSAFDADQDGDFSSGSGIADVGAGLSERERFAVCGHEPLHRGDLATGGVDRGAGFDGSRGPDGEHDSVDSALAEARQIDVPESIPCGEVPLWVEQTLCSIDVAVENHGMRMKAPGLHEVISAIEIGHDCDCRATPKKRKLPLGQCGRFRSVR